LGFRFCRQRWKPISVLRQPDLGGVFGVIDALPSLPGPAFVEHQHGAPNLGDSKGAIEVGIDLVARNLSMLALVARSPDKNPAFSVPPFGASKGSTNFCRRQTASKTDHGESQQGGVHARVSAHGLSPANSFTIMSGPPLTEKPIPFFV
jgi:hypothetical protein